MNCDICQCPTKSKYGVCTRTRECRMERSRMQRQVNAEKRRYSETGWIYFVAAWGDPYVKIGLARKNRQGGVKGRIRSMQTAHPKFLYPMHTVQSDDVFRDERIIQGFFGEDRIQGGGTEWFRVPEGTSFPDWLKDHWDWKPWRGGIEAGNG